MTALGDFSPGDVLTAADMNAIGDFKAFTPSWSGLTVGNGSQTWTYCVVNELLVATGRFTFGSTSAVTSNVDMTIPGGYTVANQNQWCGGVQYAIGGTTYLGFIDTVSTTSVRFREYNVSGSLLIRQNIGSGSPASWSSGDQIKGTFTARIT